MQEKINKVLEGISWYRTMAARPGNARYRPAMMGLFMLTVSGMGSAQEPTPEGLMLEGTSIVLRQGLVESNILVDDTNVKENLIVSPSGKKAVFNEVYKPYTAPNPGPDFSMGVLDLEKKKELCRVAVEGVGRYLNRLEWLNDRWVLIRGEYIRFFDAEACRASDLLWAVETAIAPDRMKIAFVYGPSPKRSPEPPSYAAGLALLEKAFEEQRWAWHPIFPRHSNASYPDEEWRTTGIKHFFWGQLAWDAASRRLAFVQDIAGKFWLVCLDIEPVLAKKPPIILLREPFEMVNPSYAPVSWDGDVVTVTEGQRYEPEERPRFTWTFRCPPAGSPAATTETGPAVPKPDA